MSAPKTEHPLKRALKDPKHGINTSKIAAEKIGMPVARKVDSTLFGKGLKEYADRKLDGLRITNEQSRAAGALSTVGGAAGGLSGTVVGAGIGALARKPGQGAFLGAGVGTAVGAGGGAAAGLYAARPSAKKRPKPGLKGAAPKKVATPEPVAKLRQETKDKATAGIFAGGLGAAGGLVTESAARRGSQRLATNAGNVKRLDHYKHMMSRSKELKGTADFLGSAKGRALVVGGAASYGVHRHNKKKAAPIAKARDGDGDGKLREGALAAGAVAAGAGAADQGKRWFDNDERARRHGKDARWSREATTRSYRDAANAHKVARANYGFAEQTRTSADTTHRYAHYKTMGDAWSGQAKRIVGETDQLADMYRHDIAHTRKYRATANKHGLAAAGLGALAVAAGAGAVHHSKKDTMQPVGKAMTEEQKDKLKRRAVTGALGVGMVADAAALKAGWNESKSATKAKLPATASRVARIKNTAGFAAAKGSFGLQVAGLGAGLAATKMINDKPKPQLNKPTAGQVARVKDKP